MEGDDSSRQEFDMTISAYLASGDFFQKCDYPCNEHTVQMLAATMEVHGNSIILWEDLWKYKNGS
jgi:hypothetical protein